MPARVSRLGLGVVAAGVAAATITACSSATSGSPAGAAFSVPNRSLAPASVASSAPAPAPSSAPDASTSSAAPSTVAPSTAAPSSPAASTPAPSSSSSTAPAPADKQIKVGKSFTDAAMGQQATIISYIPSFSVSPALEKKYSIKEDGEQVLLLQVHVHTGLKFFTTFGSDDFMVRDGSGYPEAEFNSLFAKDMRAAGYTPLKDAERGQNRTGWIAYMVKSHVSGYTVQYKRLAVNILGTNKTLPAKVVNIVLPKR